MVVHECIWKFLVINISRLVIACRCEIQLKSRVVTVPDDVGSWHALIRLGTACVN